MRTFSRNFVGKCTYNTPINYRWMLFGCCRRVQTRSQTYIYVKQVSPPSWIFIILLADRVTTTCVTWTATWTATTRRRSGYCFNSNTVKYRYTHHAKHYAPNCFYIPELTSRTGGSIIASEAVVCLFIVLCVCLFVFLYSLVFVLLFCCCWFFCMFVWVF